MARLNLSIYETSELNYMVPQMLLLGSFDSSSFSAAIDNADVAKLSTGNCENLQLLTTAKLGLLSCKLLWVIKMK
jgi:hypothetical protein